MGYRMNSRWFDARHKNGRGNLECARKGVAEKFVVWPRRIKAYCFSLLFYSAVSLSVHSAASAKDILFVGNSITIHGPDASLGWTGNWGMAASGPNLDYVSQTLMCVTNLTHEVMTAKVVSANAIEHSFLQLSQDRLSEILRNIPESKIVVLQFGDNVQLPGSQTDGKDFGRNYDLLLSALNAHLNAPLLICVGKWWPSAPLDEAIAESCRKAGGTFVKISDVYSTSWGKASAERAVSVGSVAAHPGDRAMKEIAERVSAAIMGNSRARGCGDVLK